MHRLLRTARRCCAAASLPILALTATASANRLSINSQNFDTEWNPITFIAGGTTIRCPVTLQGSLHSSTIAKVTNSLVGLINRAIVNDAACVGGRTTILSATLPWHITYNRFTGTLPRITRIYTQYINIAFSVQPTGFFACLARTTTERPGLEWMDLNESGTIIANNADESVSIPLVGSGGLCFFAGSGRFSGAGITNVLGTTTPIVVRLI